MSEDTKSTTEHLQTNDPAIAVQQMNMREPGKMMMRNQMTGEVKPAIPSGTDRFGRNLYKPVPGHEPVGNHTVYETGEWVEIQNVRTVLDQALTPGSGVNVQGMSGAPATLSEAARADLAQQHASGLAGSREPAPRGAETAAVATEGGATQEPVAPVAVKPSGRAGR